MRCYLKFDLIRSYDRSPPPNFQLVPTHLTEQEVDDRALKKAAPNKAVPVMGLHDLDRADESTNQPVAEKIEV